MDRQDTLIVWAWIAAVVVLALIATAECWTALALIGLPVGVFFAYQGERRR